MPERQIQTTTQILPVIAGVNQRQLATEIAPKDYSLVEGVWPEFTGLQSRMWGKRTLNKFAESVYGIYQFWTPYGYGVGLYQFDGQLDTAPWLTPTSVIDIPTLPPSLPIDNNGNTVDIFGYGFDSLFGNSDFNTPIPTPADTPDDHNGGGAGQGTKCAWTNSTVSIGIETYVASVQWGDTGPQDVVIGSGMPLPIPLPPIPEVTVGPVAPPAYPNYMEARLVRGSYAVGAQDHQNWQRTEGIVTFDFSPLESDPDFVGVVMTMRREVLTPTLAGFVDEDYFIGPEVNFTNYLPTAPSIRTVADGYQQDITVYPVAIHASYRKRVCA